MGPGCPLSALGFVSRGLWARRGCLGTARTWGVEGSQRSRPAARSGGAGTQPGPDHPLPPTPGARTPRKTPRPARRPVQLHLGVLPLPGPGRRPQLGPRHAVASQVRAAPVPVPVRPRVALLGVLRGRPDGQAAGAPRAAAAQILLVGGCGAGRGVAWGRGWRGGQASRPVATELLCGDVPRDRSSSGISVGGRSDARCGRRKETPVLTPPPQITAAGPTLRSGSSTWHSRRCTGTPCPSRPSRRGASRRRCCEGAARCGARKRTCNNFAAAGVAKEGSGHVHREIRSRGLAEGDASPQCSSAVALHARHPSTPRSLPPSSCNSITGRPSGGPRQRPSHCDPARHSAGRGPHSHAAHRPPVKACTALSTCRAGAPGTPRA